MPTLVGFHEDTIMVCEYYFIYTYVLVYYLKKYVYPKRGMWLAEHKGLILLGGMIVYLGLILFPLIDAWKPGNSVVGLIANVGSHWLADYKSIPNLIVAFSVFNYFAVIDIGSSRRINNVAKYAFVVYIFHQTPIFYKLLWEGIFRCDLFVDTALFPIWFIATTVLVYTIGSGVGLIYEKIVEKRLGKMGVYTKVCDRIDSFYSPVVEAMRLKEKEV